MKKILLLISITFSFAQNEGFKLERKGFGFEFNAFPSHLFLYDEFHTYSDDITLPYEDAVEFTLYFPLDIKNLFIEPFLGRYHAEIKAETEVSDEIITVSYEQKSTRIGLGVFMQRYSGDSKSRMYCGLRYERDYYVTEQPSTTSAGAIIITKSSPTIISPTIGVEYFILNNFSFAGEASHHMISYDETVGDIITSIKIDYLLPHVVVRMYF